MINEKMKILKMLEEGRVTAEDAAKLLDAVSSGNSAADSPAPGPSPSAGQSYSPHSAPSGAGGPSGYKPASGGYSGPNNNGPRRSQPYSPERESVGEDLSRRFETFFKDMEPKLQRFAETVVQKTSNAADAISRSLTPPTPAPRPSYSPPPRTPADGRTQPQPAAKPYSPVGPSGPSVPSGVRGRNERVFEQKVQSAGSELIIDGFNGQVLLKGYNGDKISAKVFYNSKRGNPAMELMALGSKYYLSYDESEYESVSVDAYIPESMFSDIRVSTSNGPLIVSTVAAENVKIQNANGDIEITGLSANDLIAETNNGQTRLSGVTAGRAVVEDFNGAITVSDLDVGQLKMSTFNGGVTMHINKFNAFTDYMWAVEANNGKVGMVLPSSVEIGYYVRANAALSEVRIGLTGMAFSQNTKTFAEAQSVNFDQAIKKIRLLLETSNAPLVVN